MMNMWKFLFFAMLFYFLYRSVRNYFRRLMNPPNPNNYNQNNNQNVNSGRNKQSNSGKYNITSKDIVDAEFTEIKPEDENKTKNN